MFKHLVINISLALFVFSLYVHAAPLPPDAAIVIAKVHKAAKLDDYTALKSLMVDDFIWSFGGDQNAAQAIENWKTDSTALKKLIKVTSQLCSLNMDGDVECPSKAGTAYRAGFKQTPDGWRMFYFVGGD